MKHLFVVGSKIIERPVAHETARDSALRIQIVHRFGSVNLAGTMMPIHHVRIARNNVGGLELMKLGFRYAFHFGKIET